MKLSSTRNTAFHCDFTRAAPDTECYRLKMPAGELETVVFKKLRKHAQAIINSANDSASQIAPKTEPDTQIAQIESEMRGLYERYVLGEVNADEFKSVKLTFENELRIVKNAQSVLKKETARKSSVIEYRQAAEDVLDAKELCRPVIDALVDKIQVYPNGRIEVTWYVTAATD